MTEKKTLVEQANEIIMQDALTAEDVTKLAKIRWRMSCEYANAKEQAGQGEVDFQKKRTDKWVQGMKQGKSDSQSKEIGRYEAEKKAGTYRFFKEFAVGMNAQIKAIEGVMIDYYRKQKDLESASMVTQEGG